MIKKDIEVNARVILQHLNDRGKLSVIQLSELTNFKEIMIILSLGWLAKENLIYISNTTGILYAELIHKESGFYF